MTKEEIIKLKEEIIDLEEQQEILGYEFLKYQKKSSEIINYQFHLVEDCHWPMEEANKFRAEELEKICKKEGELNDKWMELEEKKVKIKEIIEDELEIKKIKDKYNEERKKLNEERKKLNEEREKINKEKSYIKTISW